MSKLIFNAETIEPSNFDPLPAGCYVVEITASEMRQTRAGDGQYLALEMKILEGDHKGRAIFDRLNLENPNPQAMEIAQRTLTQICHAVGVLSVTDSEQLHGKPLVANVRIRPAGPDRNGIERDAANEIRGYRALTGASATTSPASSTARATTPGKAPWNKS